jgi:hypothetical protein
MRRTTPAAVLTGDREFAAMKIVGQHATSSSNHRKRSAVAQRRITA